MHFWVKMKKIFFALLTLTIIASVFSFSFAQSNYLKRVEVDRTVGIAGKNFVAASAIQRIHQLAMYKNIRFGIGYGLRYSISFVRNQSFIASPNKFASDDRLAIMRSCINTLNADLHFQLSWGKFDVGFNIDVVGVGFGKAQMGVFSIDGIETSRETARPTPFNILMGPFRDIGSLHSERYIRYWLNKKLAVKLALGRLFGEYTTLRKLNLGNDRFRTIYKPIIAGISYRFWQ